MKILVASYCCADDDYCMIADDGDDDNAADANDYFEIVLDSAAVGALVGVQISYSS